jgi:hypothetical protein
VRQPIFFVVCFPSLFSSFFYCFPFFLTFQNTQGSGGRSGAGRRNPEEGRRVGDGEQQRDGGGARVEEKKNKDRTQSNQQQLNA